MGDNRSIHPVAITVITRLHLSTGAPPLLLTAHPTATHPRPRPRSGGAMTIATMLAGHHGHMGTGTGARKVMTHIAGM